MLDCTCDLRFPQKPFSDSLFTHERRVNHLESDFPSAHRNLPSAVSHTHAAAPQFNWSTVGRTQNLEIAKSGSCRDGG